MEKTQYNFCWVNQIKLMSCLQKLKIGLNGPTSCVFLFKGIKQIKINIKNFHFNYVSFFKFVIINNPLCNRTPSDVHTFCLKRLGLRCNKSIKGTY